MFGFGLYTQVSDSGPQGPLVFFFGGGVGGGGGGGGGGRGVRCSGGII